MYGLLLFMGAWTDALVTSWVLDGEPIIYAHMNLMFDMRDNDIEIMNGKIDKYQEIQFKRIFFRS